MANTPWFISATQFGSCNCDYGCPCQFEAKPTYGKCRGFEASEISEGHFGEVRLDGLRFAMLYAWPGPIYEGKGEMQAVIDERASAEQRKALETVLHGGETEEAATHYWVFRAMSDKVHETLYRPISLSIDVEARQAEVKIPGVILARGEPIKSPVSGAPHRVRIDLPDGIEFEIAEVGSGTTSAEGAITLDLAGTYAQFSRQKHTGRGFVRGR